MTERDRERESQAGPRSKLRPNTNSSHHPPLAAGMSKSLQSHRPYRAAKSSPSGHSPNEERRGASNHNHHAQLYTVCLSCSLRCLSIPDSTVSTAGALTKGDAEITTQNDLRRNDPSDVHTALQTSRSRFNRGFTTRVFKPTATTLRSWEDGEDCAPAAAIVSTSG